MSSSNDLKRYKDALEAARETRDIEFKGPMLWSKADRCSQFELLKDIAALANIGGGLLIAGRSEPDYKKGSLSDEQTRSFDSTAVNETVYQFLAPPHSCLITRTSVRRKRVAFIDVPGFTDWPLVFQTIGNCGKCKTPHFKPGDVFVRSRKHQTKKVTEAYEMRDMMEVAIKYRLSTADAVLRRDYATAIQRLERLAERFENLDADDDYSDDRSSESRSVQTSTEPDMARGSSIAAQDLSAYAEGPFYPWTYQTGHYRLTLYPQDAAEDRIPRQQLAPLIKQLVVSVMPPDAEPFTVPFASLTEPTNNPGFAEYGDRDPKVGRYEMCRLHQAGVFTLVRIFPDDYSDGTLTMSDKVLEFGRFVDTITALYFLGGNIAKKIGNRGERFALEIKVDGLLGRALLLKTGAGTERTGHPCTVPEMPFGATGTGAQLTSEYLKLAAESISETLWNFGYSDQNAIARRQRETRIVVGPGL